MSRREHVSIYMCIYIASVYISWNPNSLFILLAGVCRSRVTVILRKKFPTPKDAEKAMAQKEALTDATHAPTNVLDDHLLTEGIDALKISYMRT